MIFLISWRNIWRNRKRTLVLISAIVIGVWSMIFLGSLMRGMQVQLVKNSIATLTGHIQIHVKEYREDPAVENSIDNAELIISRIEKVLPPDSHWATRVRVPGVASNAYRSAGITITGIDTTKEKTVSFVKTATREGEYLKPDDRKGIIIGHALARDFRTGIGKKIILTSQDMDGNIASRAFRIRGIFYADTESTEKTFAFVTLEAAQDMLKMGGRVSEIVLSLPDYKEAEDLAGRIRKLLPDKTYEINSWRELLPMAVAMLKMYDFFIFIWYIVAFIAMAFGIVNTTSIAILERVREFGLMQALGMKPSWIIGGILIESAFILFLGMGGGNIGGFLSVAYLAGKGLDLSVFSRGAEFFGIPRIIYPVALIGDILTANLIVIVLGVAVSLYPAWRATRFRIVKALGYV